jgi:YegS/Rv2252/BmrU family lipid kinase
MDSTRRCAVVYNPIKVDDDFRDLAQARLAEAGYAEPLWLETQEDDPGHAMTERAVAEKVDLVVAAGGDGTVRVVGSGLAGTGIPLGLVPSGTGNLLARNLDLPLKADKAFDVIVAGHTRAVDTIVLTVDDGEPQRFLVMAGTGIDAVIMDETDENLKAKIGPAAYFLAAGRALDRVPIPVRIQLDDQPVHHRESMICLIGNVGQLTGGITLIPRAEPDDGVLDVYVASPQKAQHWFRALVRLVTARPRKSDPVDLWVGKRVEIVLDREDTYQLDGDVQGSCRRLVGEVDPGSLLVCVPG